MNLSKVVLAGRGSRITSGCLRSDLHVDGWPTVHVCLIARGIMQALWQAIYMWCRPAKPASQNLGEGSMDGTLSIRGPNDELETRLLLKTFCNLLALTLFPGSSCIVRESLAMVIKPLASERSQLMCCFGSFSPRKPNPPAVLGTKSSIHYTSIMPWLSCKSCAFSSIDSILGPLKFSPRYILSPRGSTTFRSSTVSL